MAGCAGFRHNKSRVPCPSRVLCERGRGFLGACQWTAHFRFLTARVFVRRSGSSHQEVFSWSLGANRSVQSKLEVSGQPSEEIVLVATGIPGSSIQVPAVAYSHE